MNKRLVIIAICITALVILFTASNPNNVPSFVLMLPFILIAAVLFVSVTSLLKVAGFSKQKTKRIAVISTALPVVVLVLQSVGQLTLRDVLTIVFVFLLSYFYISRMTSPTAS